MSEPAPFPRIRYPANPVMIGVIGMDDHAPEEPLSKLAWFTAETVGRLVAERGGVLVTGGRGGIMEAASKGAFQAGGITVGVLPGSDKAEANQYVNVPLATALGGIRSHVMVTISDCLIMISGSSGTFSEVGLAYFHRPLVVIEGTGGWADRLRAILYEEKHLDPRRINTIHFASSAEEAVALAFALVESREAARPGQRPGR